MNESSNAGESRSVIYEEKPGASTQFSRPKEPLFPNVSQKEYEVSISYYNSLLKINQNAAMPMKIKPLEETEAYKKELAIAENEFKNQAEKTIATESIIERNKNSILFRKDDFIFFPCLKKITNIWIRIVYI